MDYRAILDQDVVAFIDKTLSFYSADLAADDWQGQRAAYDRMAAHFHAGRPAGLAVSDGRIADVPVRIYGEETATVIVYVHGGGFVLGGLDSHDDVCAEIAAATQRRVVSVDYRLSPEHRHPAAYDDLLAVVKSLVETCDVVLCGDSAGASLCACLCGCWHDARIIGQFLIYPALGFAPEGGSFERHAHAPLLSRDEVEAYGAVRGGERDDPRATASAGDLARLPPTFIFPAECDPLHDDALRYAEAAAKCGTDITVETSAGLVHGWLRARHESTRAARTFAGIAGKIAAFCAG
ncbi:alpha/beta hydrolase [Martelella sp. HB161492]|uniref:alpha/beta hydrolase n=1 Tax=Martelella sp. HB161492 TaxID=2720726 RepID=UPI00159183AF|nr:alpha/beta hydrolase [Martelella sp. HB161492]